MNNMVSLKAFDTDLGISYSRYASSMMDTSLWIVKKAFVYHLNPEKTQKVIVPLGFLTDGASVPRVFWSMIPPWGSYGQAAVLHDWLCLNMYFLDGDIRRSLNRGQIDTIFNTAMKDLGVPDNTRTAIYAGVKAYYYCWGRWTKVDNEKLKTVEAYLGAHFNETGEWI